MWIATVLEKIRSEEFVNNSFDLYGNVKVWNQFQAVCEAIQERFEEENFKCSECSLWNTLSWTLIKKYKNISIKEAATINIPLPSLCIGIQCSQKAQNVFLKNCLYSQYLKQLIYS